MSRRLCRVCQRMFVILPLLVSTCADTRKLKAWTRQVCEANSDKVLRAINDTDSFGTTPLMIACFHGHLDVALHLLSRQAAPNAANNRGRTALFHSLSPPPKPLPGESEGTYSQSFERARMVARSLVVALLQHQANACHMDHNGITPLRLAAVRHPPRHPVACRLRACASRVSGDSRCPIRPARHDVCRNAGTHRHVRVLVRRPGPLGRRGCVMLARLHLPAPASQVNGYHQCAKLLLAAGADPHRRDLNGFSVIQSVEAMVAQAAHSHALARLYHMLDVLCGNAGASAGVLAWQLQSLTPIRPPSSSGRLLSAKASGKAKHSAAAHVTAPPSPQRSGSGGLKTEEGQQGVVATLLATGARGMQGVRWMPASVAQKLVRAAAQLPCEPAEMCVAPRSSSWSARHAPAAPDSQEGVAVAVGRDGLTRVDGHGEEQVSGARARDARTGEGARGCTKTVESAMEWARRELVSKEVVTAGSRVKVLVVGAEPLKEYRLVEARVIESRDDAVSGLGRPQQVGKAGGRRLVVTPMPAGKEGQTGSEARERLMAVSEHMVVELWQGSGEFGADGAWKALGQAFPPSAVCLFSEEGRQMLAVAEDGGTSACATVAPVFAKQRSPTSCGVCCAVVAANFLARATSGDASASWDEARVRQESCSMVRELRADVLDNHGLTLKQVGELCLGLVGVAGRVLVCSQDTGHSLADFRRACVQQLGSGGVIIANMYMGDEAKGGIGSVFEMGHFALIAAFAPGTALSAWEDAPRASTGPGRRRRGSAASASGESREVVQEDAVLVMDVWAQACDAYWVPLGKVRPRCCLSWPGSVAAMLQDGDFDCFSGVLGEFTGMGRHVYGQERDMG